MSELRGGGRRDGVRDLHGGVRDGTPPVAGDDSLALLKVAATST